MALRLPPTLPWISCCGLVWFSEMGTWVWWRSTWDVVDLPDGDTSTSNEVETNGSDKQIKIAVSQHAGPSNATSHVDDTNGCTKDNASQSIRRRTV
jgi:hypothetical protein